MSIMMEYLRQLHKNNQRDWFQSHKELRKEAEAGRVFRHYRSSFVYGSLHKYTDKAVACSQGV